VICALAQESAWAGKHENIFVLGPTGVGKSFVASALAPLSEPERRPPLLYRPVSILHPPAENVNRCPSRGGEFSTGTMGNFQPELTVARSDLLTQEFKLAAVRRLEQGISIGEVARGLEELPA
jgi:energy-coupling factor transporter ATP-binding protein EcfA2